MDKRIVICLIAGLLALVVTAAYAPNPGTGTKADSETTATEEMKAEEKTVAKQLEKVLDNQTKILAELKALKESQELIQKDTKFIRSKTH